jgi:hypothetical protein
MMKVSPCYYASRGLRHKLLGSSCASGLASRLRLDSLLLCMMHLIQHWHHCLALLRDAVVMHVQIIVELPKLVSK